MNTFKKITVCGVLAASMAAAPLAGCGQVNGDATAIVVNDEKINLGTAAFFLRYQQAESATMMQNYGMAAQGASIWSQQYTAATSSADATTYGDYMKHSAEQMLVQAVLLNQHADEYKVTIPDELQTSINDVAEDTYNQNKDAMDKMGTTEDDIKHVLELSTVQRLIFYPMTEDTDTNVSDEDAAESTMTYARIALTKYDSDTQQTNPVSDEDKETYKKELESLLTQVKDSGDTASADMKTMASNLDNQNIACTTYSYGADDTVMPDEVMDAAKTLSDGQIYDGVIDTGDYYYLVRLDKKYDPDATEKNRQNLIDQRRQQNYQDKLDKWEKDSTVVEKRPWKKLEVTDSDAYLATVNNDNVVSSSDFSSSSSGSDSVSSTSGEAVSR